MLEIEADELAMNDSGYIRLDDEIIRYRSKVFGDWDLPVSALRILGESTNQSGPFADDYFLCFATGPGMWLEASFYADGRDAFPLALGQKLGAQLDLGLCGSTDFASRVLWPHTLAGEPMFQYKDESRIWLLGKIFGACRNHQTYVERVAAALAVTPSP